MTIITLLTDFGVSDSYVAEMKGVILCRLPAATLVDVTHQVPPGDVRAGAYLLSRSWHQFPRGTVHLVVVDPGVGTGRAALALHAGGHAFLGPDNGVLSPVATRRTETVRLSPSPKVAPTFHGRDLFAPAAAALASGAPLHCVGEPHREPLATLPQPEPVYEGKTIVGDVVYVDRFGTLVTNLTAGHVPPYARVEVETLDIGPLRRTFGDVPTGGLLAFIGSAGTVEVAVRDGSAARRLGLGVGGKVRARLG